MGFSQARILEWVAVSFLRGSSPPMDQTHVSCIGRRIFFFFYHWATREAQSNYAPIKKKSFPQDDVWGGQKLFGESLQGLSGGVQGLSGLSPGTWPMARWHSVPTSLTSLTPHTSPTRRGYRHPQFMGEEALGRSVSYQLHLVGLSTPVCLTRDLKLNLNHFHRQHWSEST